jgi:purine-binding chemotaxis protein CheW
MVLKSNNAENQQHFLLFNVGDYYFCLGLADIFRIIHFSALLQPAGMPAILEGFLNLRGSPIPVINLARLLNQPEVKQNLYTPLIILKDGPDKFALLVEGVSEIISFQKDEMVQFQKGEIFNEIILGELKYGELDIFLLDKKKILLEKEQKRIDEFKKVAVERIKNLAESKTVAEE